MEENGYRYYDDDKILELQQILFFRELGYKLKDIREIIRNPGFSIENSLEKQKKLLIVKKRRIQRIIDLIDKTISNIKGDNNMGHEEFFEDFSEEKLKEYTKRAKEEYGEEVVGKSVENFKKIYGKDYGKMQRQFIDWLNAMKENMDKGFDSPEIQTQVKKWHELINNIFDCPKETYMGLAYLYRDNEEFAVNFRKSHEKMPEFVFEAIQFYCSND